MQKYLMDIRPGSYELQRDPHTTRSRVSLTKNCTEGWPIKDITLIAKHGIVHDNFRVVAVTKFKLEDYLSTLVYAASSWATWSGRSS